VRSRRAASPAWRAVARSSRRLVRRGAPQLQQPSMTAMRLLTSWATPAVEPPRILSNRLALRSASSMLRRSLISIAVP